jgi:CheY-like chemotaxis protein
MADSKGLALLADDEDDVRSILKMMLEVRGWRVLECDDGEDVARLAVEHMPDVIVLDVMMPHVNGFEAFRQLRLDHRTGHIPIIMLTAVNDFELGTQHTAESLAAQYHVQAPEAFFEKPLNSIAMVDKIEDVAGR